jgi:hypothetical protein
MRYAVIFTMSNSVDNVIEWDGVTPHEVLEGQIKIPDPDNLAQIGGTYNPADGTFTAPVITTVKQTTIEQIQAQLAALTDQLNTLTTNKP